MLKYLKMGYFGAYIMIAIECSIGDRRSTCGKAQVERRETPAAVLGAVSIKALPGLPRGQYGVLSAGGYASPSSNVKQRYIVIKKSNRRMKTGI